MDGTSSAYVFRWMSPESNNPRPDKAALLLLLVLLTLMGLELWTIARHVVARF
jgi:hypothetical protein